MASSNFSDDDDEHSKLTSTLYDESIDVVDAEEVQSPASSNGKPHESFSLVDSPPPSRHSTIDDYLHKPGTSSSNNPAILAIERPNHRLPSGRRSVRPGSDHSDNSDDDDDDDDDDVQAATLEGSYDPSEYDHLPVAADIRELFQHITRYTPQNIELDYKLRPFIPDFIPAVGDIDAFLKIPRPDGKTDSIGLQVLDEPCANQSEPAVLHLQLRAVAKQSSAKAVVVKKVENAERNSRALDRWIKDISDLHHSKPAPTVHYNKPMPDIDSLMQEWPPEFERFLHEVGLPTADLDCDLKKFVDIVCSLFDIPVYESRIQSLHVLFSLYAAVKASQYFNRSENQSQVQD